MVRLLDHSAVGLLISGQELLCPSPVLSAVAPDVERCLRPSYRLRFLFRVCKVATQESRSHLHRSQVSV